VIRNAAFADIPAIVSLLHAAYLRTHYARSGLVEIDIPETKRLLVNGIQRHGGKNGGACFVQVSDTGGAVTGLIFGTLVRVYSIGNKLACTDLFWLTAPGAAPLDGVTLMRNMIAWARSCPHVVEMNCGATAIMNDPAEAGRLLEGLGMERYGHLHRMELTR
jgi:hypothetical protein